MAKNNSALMFEKGYTCRTKKECLEVIEKIYGSYDTLVDTVVEQKKGLFSSARTFNLEVTVKTIKDKDGLLYDITAKAYK